MESKYYTPSIEEFKVGFRYESCGKSIYSIVLDLNEEYIKQSEPTKDWNKREFDGNEFNPFKVIFEVSLGLRNNNIRVKCLDESDILEAGWIETNKNPNSEFKTYVINAYRLTTNYKDYLVIEHRHGISNLWNSNSFHGTIRNYNELLDVMRMLEIKRDTTL